MLDLQLTLLDFVYKYRESEEYFKKLGEEIGQCILCTELFTPVQEIFNKYSLDVDKISKDLEKICSST